MAERVTSLFGGHMMCRSPIETSPASPIEMSRSSVRVRLVEVAWDDGDHDEPQRADAPAGADRCCRRTPVCRRCQGSDRSWPKEDLPAATPSPKPKHRYPMRKPG